MVLQNRRTNEIDRGKALGDDGFSRAYRYRDPKSRMYEVTTDRLEAERAVGSGYEVVLAHFTDGFMDRVVESDLTEEEGFAEGIGESAFPDNPLQVGSSRAIPEEGRSDETCSNEGRRSRRCQHASHPDHPENGLGIAYRYVDPKMGTYGWTPDETYARLAAEGGCEAVWVFYQDGGIAKPASADAYQEELEVRVGERISEGLSDYQLNEFDLIDDPDEARRWLEENRPDFHHIVAQTKQEMERAIVLEEES